MLDRDVEYSIEVHRPVLGTVSRDRFLHLDPLSDEVGEHLRLYSLSAPELDGVRAELYRPLASLL